MVMCKTILDALERIAPKRLVEEWDNSGLLIGSPAQRTDRVLVALDVTDAVVTRAMEKKADMIVAHHPVIFNPLKHIRTDLSIGARIQTLLKHDIAVAAAHTNLDIARGGVNDVLAEAIGLEQVSSFVLTEQHKDGTTESLGRVGSLLVPMRIEDFAETIKEALPVTYVRMVKVGERTVRKVAICSGSGAEFIGKAAFLGADAYVTGDVRYHDAQQAMEFGMHVIDAGHFGTEFPIVGRLAERLQHELETVKGEVEILCDDVSHDVFTVV